MEINDVLSLQPTLLKAETKEKEAGAGFGQILNDILQQTNKEIIAAEKMSQDFALGKGVELHQVVLAAEKADLALQMTIELRNKIVEAYQEIMRMQV